MILDLTASCVCARERSAFVPKTSERAAGIPEAAHGFRTSIPDRRKRCRRNVRKRGDMVQNRAGVPERGDTVQNRAEVPKAARHGPSADRDRRRVAEAAIGDKTAHQPENLAPIAKSGSNTVRIGGKCAAGMPESEEIGTFSGKVLVSWEKRCIL